MLKVYNILDRMRKTVVVMFFNLLWLLSAVQPLFYTCRHFLATTPAPGKTTSFMECITAEVTEGDLENDQPTSTEGATVQKKPDGTVEYTFDVPISVMEIDVQTKSGDPIKVEPIDDEDKPATNEPLVWII